MKKTYWWRVVVIFIILSLFALFYYWPCENRLSRCMWGNNIVIVRTVFHFGLGILAIIPFLFFISDKIFLKWLKFAVVWFGITAILVAISPEYSGGYIGFKPTKEIVSIWMGSLFVILSLAKITWDWKKSKKSQSVRE